MKHKIALIIALFTCSSYSMKLISSFFRAKKTEWSEDYLTSIMYIKPKEVFDKYVNGAMNETETAIFFFNVKNIKNKNQFLSFITSEQTIINHKLNTIVEKWRVEGGKHPNNLMEKKHHDINKKHSISAVVSLTKEVREHEKLTTKLKRLQSLNNILKNSESKNSISKKQDMVYI